MVRPHSRHKNRRTQTSPINGSPAGSRGPHIWRCRCPWPTTLSRCPMGWLGASHQRQCEGRTCGTGGGCCCQNLTMAARSAIREGHPVPFMRYPVPDADVVVHGPRHFVDRGQGTGSFLPSLVPSNRRLAAAPVLMPSPRLLLIQPAGIPPLIHHPRRSATIATAECVAERLLAQTDMDWSAAVIGLCKAFEVELVQRVIEPLKEASAGTDLSPDIADHG